MTSIGLNLPPVAEPEALSRNLRRTAEWGFDAAEFCLDSVPLIIGGEICSDWLALVKTELSSHPLGYTAHIGRDIDCRLIDDFDISLKALLNSVRICNELSARILVVHYEEHSRDSRQEANFRKAYREAAELAGNYGITICMENIEVELVEPVVGFVEAMDHPNLALNFDTGHAFLAASWFGFDYLAAFEKFLPRLGHMHLSDNTGRFEPLRITDRARYDSLPMGNRFTYGRGDIHLPPYFGKVPYDELFSRLAKTRPDYAGSFICEYYSSYFIPFNAAIQGRVRAAIEASRARAGSSRGTAIV